MSSEWQIFRLADTGRIVTGKTPKGGTPEYEGDGVPFVTPPDFSGTKWIVNSNRTISELGAQSVKSCVVPARSVLVTCIGSDMGKAALASSTCVTNQQVNAVVVDETKFCPEFLYYNLSLRKDEIRGLAGGSAQPILNKSAFGQLCFGAPSLAIQKSISAALRPIDDRITLLRETNATLEAIAQALFKSWFVDFDPVRAKLDGRAPEGMDEATAALFPDSFEDSELGEVPRGWRCSPLGAFCSRVESGGTPRRSVPEYWAGNVPWLTSGEVRAPIVFDTKEKISELGVAESSAKLWPAGTTVVAMYGATAGEVCLLANPATANQACCGLLPQPGFRAFLFLGARREREALAAKSSGSAQQNLNKGLVEGHRLMQPSEAVAHAFESDVGPVLDSWIANEQRVQTLAAIRDALLPRLISGQLRLPMTNSKASVLQSTQAQTL